MGKKSKSTKTNQILDVSTAEAPRADVETSSCGEPQQTSAASSEQTVSKPKKKKAPKKSGADKEVYDTESLIKLEVIKGYNVLPVLVPKLTQHIDGEQPSTAIHYLYFKRHLINPENGVTNTENSSEVDESQSLPPGRTLFVTNLPADCKEQDLAQLFSNPRFSGGCRVVKVLIRTPNSLCTVPRSISLNKSNFFKKPSTPAAKNLSALFPSPVQLASGRLENSLLTYPNYAFVVLKEVAGVEKLFEFSLKKASRAAQTGEPKVNFCESSLLRLQLQTTKGPNSGMDRWIGQYDAQRPDSALLQEYVDEYMGEYKHHKQTQQYQASMTLDAADEDGFVKVVKGRSANTAGDGATVRAMSKIAAKQLNTKITLERRNQELLGEDQKMHFYKLQAHESKRTRLARLRQEFEEDKQRIAEFKRQRLAKNN